MSVLRFGVWNGSGVHFLLTTGSGEGLGRCRYSALLLKGDLASGLLYPKPRARHPTVRRRVTTPARARLT